MNYLGNGDWKDDRGPDGDEQPSWLIATAIGAAIVAAWIAYKLL